MSLISRFFMRIGVALLFVVSVFSWSGAVSGHPAPGVKQRQQQAEVCIPGTAFADLDINNVRARIDVDGHLWWKKDSYQAGSGYYYVPQNAQTTSFFNGSIWIGGRDINGNIKMAAQLYSLWGSDFYPGPLTKDGQATVDAATCDAFDRLYKINRSDVENFRDEFARNPSLNNYTVPQCVREYPAHGDPSLHQSYYLAPFFDADHDGTYNYLHGDYPYFDFDNTVCGRSRSVNQFIDSTAEGNGVLVDQVLKGDQVIWWVMNDKGGPHNGSNSTTAAIGLEVRAQAFAYKSDNEINDMTFYSYEIINRSSQALYDSYFSVFAKSHLGSAWDDYVGCEVQRGLGYIYNGKDPDGSGQVGDYGAQPPAAGIDFIQGPYMDPDGIDNPRYAGSDLICSYGINGANFGDNIVDNERYGMGRFMVLGGIAYGDHPQSPHSYYLYMRGLWLDESPLVYWGWGHPNAMGIGPECRFMFPWDSDPCNWGTNGVDPGSPYSYEHWWEVGMEDTPYQRTFTQSAGPFTMEPGEVNYVTLGVPWARARTGGPVASLEALFVADDKAQRLFDNCFKVAEGPHAPDLTIQELDQELILCLSNPQGMSNNYRQHPEDYCEMDPQLVYHDSIPAAERPDSCYRFEGYQIFQLVDAGVTVDELNDPNKARLVAQCDRKNGVGAMNNYYFNEDIQAVVGVQEVQGSDAGIIHSFRILEDKFGSGEKRLVNHRPYYYMAIAYASFQGEWYDPANPLTFYGQRKPYLCSQRAAMGKIIAVQGVPHSASPAAGGTILHSDYGVQPRITRIEGQGNGGLILELRPETRDEILRTGFAAPAEYAYNKGPVNIKVIDPLNVIPGDFTLRFLPGTDGEVSQCGWVLTNTRDGRTWTSDAAISADNEQLIPEIGLSVHIAQPAYPGDNDATHAGFLGAGIEFADPAQQWLSGFPDSDADANLNWIRSGCLEVAGGVELDDYIGELYGSWLDPNEIFEDVLQGGWAPYALTSCYSNGPGWNMPAVFSNRRTLIKRTASIDVILTPDRSKWSRCPVFEMCEEQGLSEGSVKKLELRAGATDGETGMGWFPGYAINVETGERLNMAFGEDSGLQTENGSDMIWNPTGDVYSGLGDVLLGGKHWIYIFGHNRDSLSPVYGNIDCPAYDAGQWLKSAMEMPTNHDKYQSFIWKDCMWVACPATTFTGYWEPHNMPCEVTIRLRMARPYQRFFSAPGCGPQVPENDNYPMYAFSTQGLSVETGRTAAAEGALDMIRVVPNPYFSYGSNWSPSTDSHVKIINLPEKCTIEIYSLNGALVRRFEKNDALSYLDWDVRSSDGSGVSAGIYLFNVRVEGVGEKVVKWMGSANPSGLIAR